MIVVSARRTLGFGLVCLVCLARRAYKADFFSNLRVVFALGMRASELNFF